MKPIGVGNWYHWTLIFIILIIHVRAKKEKRQIFREQVLPALGGKIPEEAFKTDRLALNRLNKEGITVPDGVVLDARHVHKHSQHVQTMPEVIKVYLTPDGRYVPPEGRFHYNHAKTIDTTYVIRAPYSRSNGHKYSSNFNRNKRPELPKLQTYTGFRQFTPIVVPTKPGIYKPIVTPLVLPSSADLLEETYLPSWNVHYDWDTVYDPSSDYYISNIALFDSHQYRNPSKHENKASNKNTNRRVWDWSYRKRGRPWSYWAPTLNANKNTYPVLHFKTIITDYQGFLNNVHERSSRHIGSAYRDQNGFSRITKQESRGTGMKPRATSYQNVRLHLDKTVPRYTNLTSIPETSFTCNGRRGMFADPETNCQVFHNCSGWSRTSSLCPGGTAFSEVKRRCEWWNTVQCK